MIGRLLCLLGVHYEQLEITMIDGMGRLSRTCTRCGCEL